MYAAPIIISMFELLSILLYTLFDVGLVAAPKYARLDCYFMGIHCIRTLYIIAKVIAMIQLAV